VIYFEMLQRLDYDQDGKKPEQVRTEFDGLMETKRWRITEAEEIEESETDKKAPWWWDGDEEASSSFLTAMGVDLDK
jgi:hypothetical protein